MSAVEPGLVVGLTGNPLDRASVTRSDFDGIRRLRAADEARALPVWNGKPLIALDGGPRLAWLRWPEAESFAAEGPVFLGLQDGDGRFALDASHIADPAQSPLADHGKFIDLRTIGPDLTTGEPAITAQAMSILGWHARHRHCARCGASTRIGEAGWRRDCPDCKAQHFPRTDPVVIMLVAHGERCVLGRQASWPQGRHSIIAGFVEPGETIEEAVARETIEEIGLRVGAVRYVASQPWPFPSNLMIGCVAEALDDMLAVDEDELESAFWTDRATILRALAGEEVGFFLPPEDAIAHTILKAWAEGRA